MNDYSELLAICIPTYNRPNFIKKQIETLGPILKKYNIKVYISDNSESNDTKMIIEKYKDKFDISYFKNETNIKDRNFLKAISYPSAQYRWIISDSTIFDEANLNKLIDICKMTKYDYILLNTGRSEIITDQEYNDYNLLLNELGWHLTHLSSFVYSKTIIEYSYYIERYSDGNFIHHALLFEVIPFKDKRIYWIGSFIMNSLSLKKVNTWTNITYEIWTKRWTEYIFSLPDKYTLENKLKCIKDHGIKSSLFTFKKILIQYCKGVYNREIYKKYNKYFKYTMTRTIRIILFFVLFFPNKPLARILKVYKFNLKYQI